MYRTHCNRVPTQNFGEVIKIVEASSACATICRMMNDSTVSPREKKQWLRDLCNRTRKSRDPAPKKSKQSNAAPGPVAVLGVVRRVCMNVCELCAIWDVLLYFV